MALAMGLEMAIARVGVFAVFSISPWLANMAPATVVRPVAFCTLLLLIGLLTYAVFTFMDRKLDKQLGLETRYLGSAYSLIFWIQNIGLCLFPAVIGYALKFSNPGHVDGTAYNYTLPMVIFASCGIAAMLLGLWLKAEDRKKKYGLELPNIKK